MVAKCPLKKSFDVHILSITARLVWLSLTRFCCHNWSLDKVTGSNWAAYGNLGVKWCLIHFTWVHESEQVTRNKTGRGSWITPEQGSRSGICCSSMMAFILIGDIKVVKSKFLNRGRENSSVFLLLLFFVWFLFGHVSHVFIIKPIRLKCCNLKL